MSIYIIHQNYAYRNIFSPIGEIKFRKLSRKATHSLVSAMYLVSSILMYAGIGAVYNLDNDTLAQMNKKLEILSKKALKNGVFNAFFRIIFTLLHNFLLRAM